MSKTFYRSFFSLFFISVFFVKMLISTAPFLIAHMDSKAINAVIMQLEIEDNAEKFPEKIKEAFIKDFCYNQSEFRFSSPSLHLSLNSVSAYRVNHMQIFYPPVATPPPNS